MEDLFPPFYPMFVFVMDICFLYAKKWLGLAFYPISHSLSFDSVLILKGI
jgi:hypothetical protein